MTQVFKLRKAPKRSSGEGRRPIRFGRRKLLGGIMVLPILSRLPGMTIFRRKSGWVLREDDL